MYRIYSTLIVIFLVSMHWSCQSKSASSTKEGKKSIYHDIIHNPATASDEESTEEEAFLAADKTAFIFGSVKQGEIVDYDFEIRNEGKRNLYILDSNSSCGCTVSEYPTEPIPPGGQSSIKVIFDTKGKLGVQEKKVSIFSNTNPNETIFVLKGEVTQ